MLVKCSHCSKEVDKKPSQIALYKTVFCSVQCQSDYKKTGVTVSCMTCNKVIYKNKAEYARNENKRFFCSRSCATTENNKKYKSLDKHPNWKDGGKAYRQIGFRYYGKDCTNPLCELKANGISINEKLLDVHHIDGNRENNQPSNLQVLCVLCHAKITRNI